MNDKIENLLEENRKFSPKTELTQNANATSEWFDDANENRLEFWKKQALERANPKGKDIGGNAVSAVKQTLTNFK